MLVPGPVNRVVLRLLSGRRLGTDRVFVGLAIRGRRSGRVFRFPVQYAGDEAGLVVAPGRAETKTWWRNLRGGPTELEVLLHGRWQPAVGEVVLPEDPRHRSLSRAYARRWPKVDVAAEPVVSIVLGRASAEVEGRAS